LATDESARHNDRKNDAELVPRNAIPMFGRNRRSPSIVGFDRHGSGEGEMKWRLGGMAIMVLGMRFFTDG
jgi:hypothetical protein